MSAPAAALTELERPREPRAQRFVAGDPLRAVAALAVFAYHVGFAALPANASASAFAAVLPGFGWAVAYLEAGIYVFFVLSGFLISRPFVDAFVRGGAVPPLGAYARNRVLRIVPLFWVVFTVMLLRHGTGGAGAGEIALVYGFAQTLHNQPVSFLVGPAWTLDVEAGFYLLVPLVALVAGRVARGLRGEGARRALVLGAAGCAFAASLAEREAISFSEDARRALPAMLFAFMPGVVLAALEPLARERLGTRPRLGRRLAVAGAALAAVAFVLYTRTGLAGAFSPLPGALAAGLAAACATAAVGGALVREWAGAGASRLLDNSVLRWLGVRSYGIYLINAAVFFELTRIAMAPGRARYAVMFALGLAATVALAALAYVLVERPFLALRTPLAARRAVGRGRRGAQRTRKRAVDP